MRDTLHLKSNGELCRRREDQAMSEAKSDEPNEGGAVGTSDGLPVRAAEGPLVTTVYSSPLPVRTNRFYHKSGFACSKCGQGYDTYIDAISHEWEAHGI